MATGTSLLLIAVGAILRYAVTAHVSWINLTTVGLVLMIVGIVGLILSLLELFVWAPRRSRGSIDDPYTTAQPRT
jgi:heme/copper-type cytochrome/quinol oxidase subunit 2